MYAPVLAILGLGAEELVLIVIVLFVLFGSTKIPQLARSLGRAKGEFEKGSRESREELERAAKPNDDERVLNAARELGIPTEGRPLADVKRDVKAKLT